MVDNQQDTTATGQAQGEMSKDKLYLSYEAVAAYLPDNERIHTFRQGDPYTLIGADWDRADILEALRNGRPEVTGPIAQRMNHGLVIYDDHGALFIETARRTDEEAPA